MDMKSMTADQLVAVYNARCGDRGQIVGHWKASKRILIERIESLGGPKASKAKPKAAERSKREPKETIGGSLAELLKDGRLGYADILQMILAAHPDARTSVRSIASVACAMRRDGHAVPLRRPAKGAE